MRVADDSERVFVAGDSFGEAGFVNGAALPYDLVASDEVHAFCVTASQVENTSTDCQLRFHRSLQSRLARQLQPL